MDQYSSLLHSVRNGDKAAFEQAIGPLQPHLLALASSLLDTPLRAIITKEDIVNETLLQAYRFLSQKGLDDPASFESWLETIVRNTVEEQRRRHMRTQKRRANLVPIDREAGRTETGNGFTLGSAIPDSTASPPSNAVRREQLARLPQELAALPAEHRAVLQMIRLENRSYAEAALLLGKTEAATRKMEQRALAQLSARFLKPSSNGGSEKRR